MITAVIPTFHPARFSNLPAIIERIKRDVLACDEIIVWDNSGGKLDGEVRETVYHAGPTTIITSASNRFTYGRYQAAELASNKTIITCDDDCLVENWNEVIGRHLQETSRALVTNLGRGHAVAAPKRYTHRYPGGECYETLLGWGACFAKSDLQVLNQYLARYGEDEILIRKADRIFPMLLNRAHEIIEVKVNHLGGASDDHALYRRRDHWRLNREAYARVKAILTREIETPT